MSQTSRTTRHREEPARWGVAAIFAIPIFGIIFAAVSVVWHPPAIVGLAYIAASFVTFLAYALDKSAAVRRKWRTPESTLHLLGLAGGWPGALSASPR